MDTETQTVAVVLINQTKVLLVKHLQKASHPTGIWGLPAGRVEDGEAFVVAAQRELYEETGITVATEDLVLLPAEYRALMQRKNGTERMVMKVYLCLKKVNGKDLKASEETLPQFVELLEVSSYPLLPNVLNAIKEGKLIGKK